MKTIIIISVVLNIIQAVIIISAYVNSLDRKNKELVSKQKTISISIPVAEDAQFVRKQIRNPSWDYVYDTTT